MFSHATMLRPILNGSAGETSSDITLNARRSRRRSRRGSHTNRRSRGSRRRGSRGGRNGSRPARPGRPTPPRSPAPGTPGAPSIPDIPATPTQYTLAPYPALGESQRSASVARPDGTTIAIDYDYARQLALAQVNNDRAAAGLSPLRLDPLLTKIAQVRSDTMIARGTFSHGEADEMRCCAADGRLMGPTESFAIDNRIPFTTLAENIAQGDLIKTYDLPTTIDKTIEAFWNSPQHKANTLNPAIASIGLGLAWAPNGDMRVTEVFADLQ